MNHNLLFREQLEKLKNVPLDEWSKAELRILILTAEDEIKEWERLIKDAKAFLQ